MQKELIFIGLGRMGHAMTEHLVEDGYLIHGFDTDKERRDAATTSGIEVGDSLSETVQKMFEKKIIWLMVPSKFVDDVLGELTSWLSKGDIVIDGGNSYYKDTRRRNEELRAFGIDYVDCGTSGGTNSARHGAALMVGGNDSAIKEIEHIFHTLAAPNAYAHVGKSGAGHFVKMVHNAIEYGMMGAIAEGLNYIEKYQSEFDIHIKEVLKPYQNSSIIESRLVSWLADSYLTDGYLENIAGEVPRGETETEMESIIASGETPILEAAVDQRRETRMEPSRIGTLLSAMRNQFGGHAVIKKIGE